MIVLKNLETFQKWGNELFSDVCIKMETLEYLTLQFAHWHFFCMLIYFWTTVVTPREIRDLKCKTKVFSKFWGNIKQFTRRSFEFMERLKLMLLAILMKYLNVTEVQ